MNNKLVSVIIINWNGLKNLEECLNSLMASEYKKIEVFFVDNASKDGSVDFIRRKYPKIMVIQNKSNLGFAKAHKVAFKKARGEAILLLNNDTILERKTLTYLVDSLFFKANLGAIQPKLLMYPEKNLIDSIGTFYLNTGFLYHYGREKDHKTFMYNKEIEVFSVKGACVLFRKETLNKTGLFDNDYFAYFEETDLSHRIWLAGYKIIYNPKAVVYHKGGGSSKQMISYILFHSYKNRICSYIKNLSLKYLLKVLFYILIFYELVTIFYLLKRKFYSAVAVQKGIFWNIFTIKKTLQKRKYIQEKIRVIKDDDFLPKLTKPVRISYYYYLLFGLKHYID